MNGLVRIRRRVTNGRFFKRTRPKPPKKLYHLQPDDTILNCNGENITVMRVYFDLRLNIISLRLSSCMSSNRVILKPIRKFPMPL